MTSSADPGRQPPADQAETSVEATLEGTKPRWSSADGEFAIWEATRPSGERVVLTGALARSAGGERLTCKGKWSEHPQHGWSFKVSHFQSALPHSEKGIRDWLQTRVKGIGPTFAAAIVHTFGDEAFARIDEDPRVLFDVRTEKGTKLNQATVAKVVEIWEEARHLRQIEAFLYSYGITANLGERLYRAYGEEVIDVLRETPYRITELRGIGFLMADRIAREMGIGKEDPERVKAGILYLLDEARGEGHTYLTLQQLLARCIEILRVENNDLVITCAGQLAGAKRIVAESDEVVQQRVYLARVHRMEVRLSTQVREMNADRPKRLFHALPRPAAPEDATPEEVEALRLPTDDQWRAITQINDHRLCMLVGGPGTGKSQTLATLLALCARNGVDFAQAAPTGKAARRMTELTGFPSQTIHKLLRWSPGDGSFEHDEDNPLPVELVIIDEASMLSLDLADALFKAIGPGTHVLLVGDIDQLPPVGVGKVLEDLIRCERVPLVRLREIFRQAQRSMIICNAHRINSGELPFRSQEEAEQHYQRAMLRDFYFVARSSPEDSAQLTVEFATERIPREFGLDARRDIMVLAPMHKGQVGLDRLNKAMQEVLNPQGTALNLHGMRVGDRIIQNKNDYTPGREIMNGEIAIVEQFTPEDRQVRLSLDDGEREVWIPLADMDTFRLAWAISIHKSQGSQFPAVVAPVSSAHYVMLSRALTYTAITRAEKLVVLVGERQALSMAVKKVESRKRNSTLAMRIVDPSISGTLF